MKWHLIAKRNDLHAHGLNDMGRRVAKRDNWRRFAAASSTEIVIACLGKVDLGLCPHCGTRV
jgi:hypothetical protein